MSSSDNKSGGRAISLDRLIALNDEIVALVRAGIPLERGLIQASKEMGGRSGLLTEQLGERLARGESLDDAFARSGLQFPKIYPAIIEAGLRSGRLAQALEGLSTIARGYSETRKAIGLALLYPILVIMVAYGLFLIFVVQVAPRFAAAFESLGLAPVKLVNVLTLASQSIYYWGPVFPILLGLLLIQWAFFSGSTSMDGGLVSKISGRLPVIGAMLHEFRSANFGDLLALLIEHQVPLDEAIQIAGAASGQRSFEETSMHFAERLRSGQSLSTINSVDQGRFPPLLAWLLDVGHRHGHLAKSLRQVAHNYRRKAHSKACFLQAVLPTALMVIIGGSCVLSYALVLFFPLSSFWNELSLPTS